MIEDYYGHITPAKNVERILQGIPGWEPIAADPGETSASVNAGGAGTKAANPPNQTVRQELADCRNVHELVRGGICARQFPMRSPLQRNGCAFIYRLHKTCG